MPDPNGGFLYILLDRRVTEDFLVISIRRSLHHALRPTGESILLRFRHMQIQFISKEYAINPKVGDPKVSLSERKEYTVKDVVNDLKKIDATPSIAYDIGNQLVYSQWTRCNQMLGSDHEITKHFKEFLDFLQGEYENMLVRGDFWRANDTPNTAFNQFLKDRPAEFLDYKFERDPEYVFVLLKKAAELRKAEIKKYKAIQKNLKTLMKDNPDDPDLLNELRLVLWIIGDYKEASATFKIARKQGWEGTVSSVVGL